MPSQHAIIVGGSSGIGLATARELLARGFEVTITGRNETRLATARAALTGAVSAIVMDAADPARVGEVFRDIGAFDHLVLALGSGRGLGPFASVSLADVRLGGYELHVEPRRHGERLPLVGGAERVPGLLPFGVVLVHQQTHLN